MNHILKFSITLIFIISLFGCNSNNDELNTSTIVGTWQLVEIYQSIGGPGNWNDVENGYKYTFLNNGNFSSNRFSECSNGTYSIESNELILDFSCAEFTTGFEKPEGILIEKITFESGYLFINPTYIFCVEGCNYKFKKISD